VPRRDWRRYVAPAAFLIAATIAVLLIRSGLRAGTVSTTTTVAAPTTTRKKKPTTTAPSSGLRFWTVQAGDTFGVISTKTGVPVATIQQLNPNVKSTSLFIGEKLRLR
jgi:LysM repeat protein